jgi:uncharacterized protein (DUF1697 family)
MNCRMPELKRCLEQAGLLDVRTLLSSGNVAFSTTRAVSITALQKRVEQAMLEGQGRSFETVVRATAHLQQLLAADPFAAFKLPAQAKRIITFLREPQAAGPVSLPIERDGACILKLEGGEVFSAYVPDAKGPVFMQLLEKTFGKHVTTRTWDTIAKCARA